MKEKIKSTVAQRRDLKYLAARQPLKGVCQEKTPLHRKKEYFFCRDIIQSGISPFSLPAPPVISEVIGADPKLICYQAPIRFKVNERKN